MEGAEVRIYRRAEFLGLPPGTLFCQGASGWDFGELCVKGETWPPDDFIERALCSIDTNSSAVVEAMIAAGLSMPLNPHYGRDGAFEADALFLVYEAADIQELQAVLAEALAVASR
jgi:hypothetical protein